MMKRMLRMMMLGRRPCWRGREGKGSKVVFYVAIFQATPIVMQLLVSKHSKINTDQSGQMVTNKIKFN